MRRRTSWWPLRLVLWLAYLLADSVAIFVLGHLAVRAGEPGHQLMAFWAPFVLVHLGGQDTITAFSKQDNELYWRHLLNLVTQAAIAGYVMAKASWPDGRLMAAMVLMFLCGCLKYTERIFSLCCAGPELLRWGSENVLSRNLRGLQLQPGMFYPSWERIEDTLSMMSKGSSSGTAIELYWETDTLVDEIISADTLLNQVHNITGAVADDLPGMLEEFLCREDRHNAYELVGHCYRRLYTKAYIREHFIQAVKGTILTIPIWWRIILLLWAIFPCVSTSIALALFVATEKGDQLHHANKVDIAVSYVLLVGAIVLDVSSAAIFIYSHFSNCIKPARCKKQWSQKLGQYNMINSAPMSRAQRLFGYDVTYTPVTDHTSIKGFILDTLLLSGQGRAWNIASTRGQLALHSRLPADYARVTLEALEKTITSSVDFSTSVLIWHVATDICYYKCTSNSDQVVKHKQISRELSNYIMYLVYKCRVMLTTSSKLVHDNAKRGIFDILSKFRKENLGEKEAFMKLLENQMEREESVEQQDSTDECYAD